MANDIYARQLAEIGSIKAAQQVTLATAQAAQAALSAQQTAADVVLTHADVVTTNANVITTANSASQSAASANAAATSASQAYQAAVNNQGFTNTLSVAASALPYEVTAITLGTAGSGASVSGEFALVVSGGPSGHMANIIVSGGSISGVRIVNPGIASTNAVPTYTLPTVTGLTGATAPTATVGTIPVNRIFAAPDSTGQYLLAWYNKAGALNQYPDSPAAQFSQYNKSSIDVIVSANFNTSARNGGSGTAILSQGPNLTRLDAGLNRSGVIYTTGSDGLTYTPLQWFNTTSSKNSVTFRSVEAEKTLTFAQADTPGTSAFGTSSAAFVSIAPRSVRWAWGSNYLYADTVDSVLRIPSAILASNYVPTGGVTLRGGTLGVANPSYDTQVGLGSITTSIRQGSALAAFSSVNSGGARTHQEVPACTRVGNWLYAVWYCLNGTLGSATNEAFGNYLAVARRPLSGGAWVEIAQIVPSDMTACRLYDPAIAEKDGRVVLLWANTCKLRSDSGSMSTAIYSYATGCWVTVLENPEAPTNSRFIFTKPRMIGYGIPSTPTKANGDLYLPVDVWRNGTYIGASFELPNTYPQVGGAGSRLCRLVVTGSGSPYLERLSIMPGTTSGDESYSETQSVMLDSGSWLSFRRTVAGIKSLTASADLTGTTSDWSGPTDATALTSMTTASRCALIRTAMGNLAFVGNTSGRTDMYLRLSANEGSTMAYSKQLVTGSTYEVSYPTAVSWIDPSTGRSKIGMTWDKGRGAGTGYPADLVWCEVFEDEIIAGTAVITTTTISTL